MPVCGMPDTFLGLGGNGPAIEWYGGDLCNLANSNLLPLVTFW